MTVPQGSETPAGPVDPEAGVAPAGRAPEDAASSAPVQTVPGDAPPAGTAGEPAALPGGAAAPAPAAPPLKVKRTRIGGIWVAISAFAVVLLLLLIFILQNSQKVEISYFGAHGHMALGILLLLGALAGILLVVLAGTARILQLRRTAKRHRRADAKAAKARAKAAAPADGKAGGRKKVRAGR